MTTPLEEYRANATKAYKTQFGTMFWDRFADWAEELEIKARAVFPLRVRIQQAYANICPDKIYIDEMAALASIEASVALMRGTISGLTDQLEAIGTAPT